MPSTVFDVTPEELESCASKVEGKTGEFTKAYNSIYTAVSDLRGVQFNPGAVCDCVYSAGPRLDGAARRKARCAGGMDRAARAQKD